MKIYNVYTLTTDFCYDDEGDCCDSYETKELVYSFLNKHEAEDYIEKFYKKYTKTVIHFIEEADLIDNYEKFKLDRKDLY